MAYSAAALTSAETTGFTNDKPMFVVQQAGTASDAHFTSDGEHVDTDKTDAISQRPALMMTLGAC